jgi:hypothetical protein
LLADKMLMHKRKLKKPAESSMFGNDKKNPFKANLKIFEIKWYPNGTSSLTCGQRTIKPAFVPPLMVRKAEWRR